MRKVILHWVKAAFPLIAGCSAFLYPAYGQQNVIADKDRTRPEISDQNTTAAKITSLSAERFNGYNEIQWTALQEEDTRRFIAEYSVDGVNFQTAGEMMPVNGTYKLEHHIVESRPLLYRIRIEKSNGKFLNSATVLLDGEEVAPVNIYPTIVKGSVVNANATFPVERIAVVSPNGQQVFARQIGGESGYINITLPYLSKGMYWMTFYGSGWQTTTKFLIAD